MNKVFIIKYGEIALKGLNKPYFERMLMDRIRKVLKDYQEVVVRKMEGVVFVTANEPDRMEEIAKIISKVFGVSTVSIAVEIDTDLETIYKEAAAYMLNLRKEKEIKTFKVDVKRSFKKFPVESPQIARTTGGKVLEACEGLKVDVHNPDCMLHIDVRREATYIYHDKVMGYGGLPLGTNGRGLILLSGGIDSPVAAWMMAKRGMNIEAIHFHSYPYTNERAKEKVLDLAKVIAGYCGRIKVHCINLIDIQQEIAMKCPEDEMTILVRRFMMKIAERMSEKVYADVLITGENLGQVASQTVQGIVVTDNAVTMPVMRPLIALDKVDIMEIAKEIGTFDISIQPFEDCCTVFLPKHPCTKPKISQIEESEAKLDVESMIEKAMSTIEHFTINC